MTTAAVPKLWELTEELHVLAQEHLELVEKIEEAGGEATDEDLERLAEIENRLRMADEESDIKCLNIARMCAEREIEIARLKAEEERLKVFVESVVKRRKRLERSNEFFEQYVISNMEAQGKKEITDGVNTIKIRESRSVEVREIKMVPASFIRRITVDFSDRAKGSQRQYVIETIETLPGMILKREADKAGAQKLLKKGREIPGLELRTNRRLKFS